MEGIRKEQMQGMARFLFPIPKKMDPSPPYVAFPVSSLLSQSHEPLLAFFIVILLAARNLTTLLRVSCP
jgi:hypothetical protein